MKFRLTNLYTDNEVLKEMYSFVLKAIENPAFIEIARLITKDIFIHDANKIAREIYKFVKDNIRYTLDPEGIELLQSPLKTLECMCGDCDDHSILNAALNMAVGNKIRFVIVGRDSVYEHVYIEVLTSSGWKASDTVEANYFGGFPDAKIKAYYSYSDNSLTDFKGFFKKIFKKIKKFFKETARTFVDGLKSIEKFIRKGIKKFASKIRKEWKAFQLKIAAEFVRWEKIPFVGALAVANVKWFAMFYTGGLTYFVDPLRMGTEDLKLIAKLGLLVVSIVMSFIGGAGIPMLIGVIADIANAAWETADLVIELDASKALLKKLKSLKYKWSMEERIVRESIYKMEAKIELLEYKKLKIEEVKNTLDTTKKQAELEITKKQQNVRQGLIEILNNSYNNLVNSYTEKNNYKLGMIGIVDG